MSHLGAILLTKELIVDSCDVYSFVVQVFVSYNIPEDEILTPLVIEKLVAEIKCHPDKF